MIFISSQPIIGDQYVIVGTVGTIVVTDKTATLKRVVLPGTYVGTVAFYDTATAAGTASTNNILTVGIPLLNQYQTIDVNARVVNGLVYAATGTPTLTFTWD